MAMAVAALVIAGTLVGCAAPRNSLGTSAGACFRVLPQAVAAVDQRGRLVGVREVKASTVAGRFPGAARLGDTSVCVFAFSRTTGSGTAPPPAPGGTQAPARYALVAVARRSQQILGTASVDQLPMRFRHLG